MEIKIIFIILLVIFNLSLIIHNYPPLIMSLKYLIYEYDKLDSVQITEKNYF